MNNKLKDTPETGHTEKGLIGLFGHTYIPDDQNPQDQRIQYQFQIIREMVGGRYVLQLFGWLDGDPTEVVVMSEAEILGPTVKLYSTQHDWHWAYEKASMRRRPGLLGQNRTA